MDHPLVYDKAKYHFDGVAEHGLPVHQAYVHTGMFLGWLVDNDLLDEDFASEFGADDLERFKAREITGPELFSLWDGALVDDMLTDEGNAFAEVYFDFQTGQYIYDYIELLAEDLKSEFHVEDSWENYHRVKELVDRRYREWKNPIERHWWQFWKSS